MDYKTDSSTLNDSISHFKIRTEFYLNKFKKHYFIYVSYVNGELVIREESNFKYNRHSKSKIVCVYVLEGEYAYDMLKYQSKTERHVFNVRSDEGTVISVMAADDTQRKVIYNKSSILVPNFNTACVIGVVRANFAEFKVPELVVKSEEEKIVERMIGETHFINEDTYEEVNYESKVREWIERKNSSGGWIERWKKYYCVNGCWMVMNGGTVRHLMSDVYGLSREEVYLSLWLISQDEEYYVKNWAEVLTPNKLPGYVFYPDGFYGRLGSMRQYLITRGWVDLEIDVIYEIVKLNVDYYENRENRLNTEKRDIYNGCK